MSDTVSIRPAAPGDGDGLAALWVDMCSYYVELDSDLFQVPSLDGLADSFEADIEAPEDNALSLVAFEDGSIVGWIWARLIPPDEQAAFQLIRELGTTRLMIEALAVLRARWREGIGRRLVGAAEEWGARNGATVVNLDTFVDSPVSLPFYEHGMGYRRRSIRFQKRLR